MARYESKLIEYEG
jgi:hypothetical protein